MGQAALKYDDFDELDQVPIPEGGIATFLTAETGSWADDDDEVPPKGITNVVKIADKLAEYGRNEDEYMVHAAEGETVIPMEVFKQNPALKDKLFAEMRIMGIEPERYIVGNELNSINPITGQPEFFLKKLFRGLKKVVKAVLPVVAKVLLTPIVGPVAASAIVDGASAIIQGGSFKDGLKAAAIGGISSFAAGKIGNKFNWAENSAKQMATQAAINTTLSGGKPRDILKSAAIAGAVTKGTEFFRSQDPSEVVVEEGVSVGRQRALDQAALDAKPFQITQEAVDQNIGGLKNVVAQDPQLYPDIIPPPDATGGVVDPTTPAGVVDATDPVVKGVQLPGAPAPVDASLELFPGAQQLVTDIDTTLTASAEDPLLRSYRREAGLPADPRTTAPDTTTTSTAAGQAIDLPKLLATEKVPGLAESFGNLITGSGEGRMQAFRDIFLPSIDRNKVRTFLEQGGKKVTGQDITDFIKENTDELNYGFIRRFAPLAATTLGLSAMTTEEIDPINIADRTTGLDLIRANPEAFRIFDDDRTYTPPRFTITRAAGADFGAPAFRPTPIDLPPLGVAEGGEIMNFPRMNGPIEGPGTETSDDIPAMLSDGEFVFTAKAVRGAGKGSREDGMRNMYKMMRQFEARV